MPARTYDLFMTNKTGFTLTKTFDHLCHGIFTPALAPPVSILPDQQVRWKSESDGFATGTEGYVKYRIEGGNADTVYIYWDNPFTLGVTNAKGLVSTTDVEPDCDFEKTKGNSTFSPPSKFEIFTSESAAQGGADPPEVVGETLTPVVAVGVAGAAGLALIPFWVFANSGITEHPYITLTVGNKANNLRGFAVRRGVDLSKGIRPLLPPTPVISLKAMMGF